MKALGKIEALEKLEKYFKPNVAAMEKKKDLKGLIKALGYQNDPDLPKQAEDVLIKVDAIAVKPLVAALKDKDLEVRRGAVRVLDRMGWSPSTDEERIGYIMAARKWEELVVAGSSNVGALIATLNDKDPDVREHAVNALAKIGQPAVKPLLAALGKSGDPAMRSGAAEALGKIGSEEAVKPLILALKDKKASVRKNVVEALGRIGTPQALKQIIIVLKDSDPEVRKSAAIALGKKGNTRAVNPLIVTLKDDNPQVRQGAIAALGNMGESRAIKSFESALKDKDLATRKVAADALEKVGWKPLKEKSQISYLIAARKWEELANLGKAATVPLIAALKDKDQVNRKDIITTLGKIGDAQGVKTLCAALKDKDPNIQEIAIEALEKMGSAQVVKPAVIVKPLIALLKDKTPFIRQRAAKALGKLGDPKAVKSLTDMLWGDKETGARKSATEALGKIKV